jgi:hypothetical protein
MGEFSQSLLKLTEFPFSYSLIGLIALISGQSSNVEELSFAKMGPLLILMGFVATTLSICDPVGCIQREIIKGRKLKFHQTVGSTGSLENGSKESLEGMLFGIPIWKYFHYAAYLISLIYSPVELKKRYKSVNLRVINFILQKGDVPNEIAGEPSAINEDDSRLLVNLVMDDFDNVFRVLEALRQQTVRTKWITAEIDRITALIYFIIIISLFIIATQLYPAFLQHFTHIFTNIEITRLLILVFSNIALVGVIIMLRFRIKGLRLKASIVFKYLAALESIRTAKESFKISFQDIERYLNDNDWTLAEYWVDRVILEYKELFLEEANKK